MPLGDARPWFFRPDAGLLERLEWSTDVIESFDASEQRIRLLATPNRYFEFSVTVSDRERRRAENALHAGQPGLWAVPVWMDAQTLGSTLASGSTSITIDTTTRDFQAGGMAMLSRDSETFEVVDIDSQTGSTLTLDSATVVTWPAGTIIAPLRIARMPEELNLARFTGDTSYGRVRFKCTEASSWPAASDGTTYRSFPVLGSAPNWTEDVDQGYLRKLQTLVTGTGPDFVDEAGSGTILLQSHRWLLDGRSQIDAFRQWLYARAGRLTAFWLPTFALDFEVVANIGSSATTIDVEQAGYTENLARGIGRQDIRIELHSGTVYYRRITGSSEISADVERLTINSALGTAVSISEIRSISFMSLARLDADAVEIAWSRHDVAEAALTTRAARNNL